MSTSVPFAATLSTRSCSRHKTLGVFVPLWRPGPCKNPKCEAYEGEEAESEPVLRTESGPAVGKTEQQDS